LICPQKINSLTCYKKFTGINVNIKGEKQSADRLALILDKTNTYLDLQDYSTQDLKVKLIDINDIIADSNEQFFNLIKED
jgi:hypothetical protein